MLGPSECSSFAAPGVCEVVSTFVSTLRSENANLTTPGSVVQSSIVATLVTDAAIHAST